MIDVKVEFEKRLYKKLKCIMNNINIVNDGKELGAWLLGKWRKDEESYILKLHEMIIPKQKVYGEEVDLSPESMIEVVNEIGHKKSNMIKAQWHIHPFSSNVPSWSPWDEIQIADLMNPEKDRKIFVFLLSGMNDIIAKVVINTKSKINIINGISEEVDVTTVLDDVEILNETNVDQNLYDNIKKEIEGKIIKEKKGVVPTVNKNLLRYYDYYSEAFGEELKNPSVIEDDEQMKGIKKLFNGGEENDWKEYMDRYHR